MGDFSDFFEDFPEQNPANWDEHGNYLTPELKAEKERLRIANAKLDAALVRKRPEPSKPKSPPQSND